MHTFFSPVTESFTYKFCKLLLQYILQFSYTVAYLQSESGAFFYHAHYQNALGINVDARHKHSCQIFHYILSQIQFKRLCFRIA